MIAHHGTISCDVRSGLLLDGCDVCVDLLASELFHLIFYAFPVDGLIVPALALIVVVVDALIGDEEDGDNPA